MHQFRVNFTRDYDVRWVHISLFVRLSATCLQSFEKRSIWYVTFKCNGSLVRHQFIIVDSSFQPQWRLHLLSQACVRLRHSYDVTGIKPLWGYPGFVGWNARKNYIKFRYAVDGLPKGWCWISASTNADTCDQKPSGGHIGDHTRKLSEIQVALSELRLTTTSYYFMI